MALPPKVTRFLRRSGRVSMNFSFRTADKVIGEDGIAGTGIGTAEVVAVPALIGTLLGNETCADMAEVVASKWAGKGGDLLGDKIADVLGRKNAKPAEAPAAEAKPKTVDEVTGDQPAAERAPAEPRAVNGARNAAR